MTDTQTVSPQIEDVIDTLDEGASGPAFHDWTENRWGGMDFTDSGLVNRRTIRLADDDGTIDLFVLVARSGVLLWKAHFDNAPASVVAATILAALR